MDTNKLIDRKKRLEKNICQTLQDLIDHFEAENNVAVRDISLHFSAAAPSDRTVRETLDHVEVELNL